MADEDFARDVLKIAVSQVCLKMEFTNIESSALEVLADLTKLFLLQVGTQSKYNAEISGRTESNYHDIVLSLEELGVADFESLLKFSNLPIVDCAWARESVSQFAPKPSVPGTIREPADNLPPHIPNILPPFPDNRSYIKTPIYNHRETDPKAIRQAKSQQRTQAENNLSRLHTREAGSHNIINYDQVYDPKTTQTVKGPFAPAKDPIEMAMANEVEPVHPPIAPTPIEPEMINKLVDPTGASSDHSGHWNNHGTPGTPADEDRHRLEEILNLQHTGNSIQRLRDD